MKELKILKTRKPFLYEKGDLTFEVSRLFSDKRGTTQGHRPYMIFDPLINDLFI